MCNGSRPFVHLNQVWRRHGFHSQLFRINKLHDISIYLTEYKESFYKSSAGIIYISMIVYTSLKQKVNNTKVNCQEKEIIRYLISAEKKIVSPIKTALSLALIQVTQEYLLLML